MLKPFTGDLGRGVGGATRPLKSSRHQVRISGPGRAVGHVQHKLRSLAAEHAGQADLSQCAPRAAERAQHSVSRIMRRTLFTGRLGRVSFRGLSAAGSSLWARRPVAPCQLRRGSLSADAVLIRSASYLALVLPGRQPQLSAGWLFCSQLAAAVSG